MDWNLVYSIAHFTFLCFTWRRALKVKPLSLLEEHPSTPSVAIGVSVYNEASRIQCLLESFLAQKNKLVNLYIWDNESEDETLSVIRRYSAKEPRIHILESRRAPSDWNEKTWGQFNLAHGVCEDFILFIDADVEFLDVHFLNRVIGELHEDRIICGIPTLVGAGLLPLSIAHFLGFNAVYPLGRGNYPYIWGIKREAFLNSGIEVYAKQVFDDVYIAQFLQTQIAADLFDMKNEIQVRNYKTLVEAVNGLTNSATRFFELWMAIFLLSVIVLIYFLPFWNGWLIPILLILISAQLVNKKHGIPSIYTIAFPLGLTIFVFIMARSWFFYSTGQVKSRGRPLQFRTLRSR